MPDTSSDAGGPDVAVVVVNYGSSGLLARNLADLGGGRASTAVVVVDNYSDDAERAAVARLAADSGWHLVSAPDNRGFGAGVNLGVARARSLGARTVLLLNPDAVLTDEVADALHDQVRRTPDALVAPAIVTSTGATYFAGADVIMTSGRIDTGGKVDAPASVRRPWATGACCALDIDLFYRAGGYDENYFLYWEDVDFSLRVADAGGRVIIRHDLSVVHDEGGTQGERAGRAKSNTYYRYNCRNRLLFATLHVDRRTLAGWIVRTPQESWQILLRGGRRQLLHSRAPAWAVLRGLLEGLALALRALVSGADAAPPRGGTPPRAHRLRRPSLARTDPATRRRPAHRRAPTPRPARR